jgi:hypothetical protein
MKVDSISDLGDWCPRLAVGRLGKVCHHANRFEQLHQEPSKVTGGREDRMKRGGLGSCSGCQQAVTLR